MKRRWGALNLARSYMLAAVIVFAGCSVEDEIANSTVEGASAVQLEDVSEAAVAGLGLFLESMACEF